MGFSAPTEADYRSLQKQLYHPGEDSRSVAEFLREISSIKRTKLQPLLLEALRRTGMQISCRVGGKKQEGK